MVGDRIKEVEEQDDMIHKQKQVIVEILMIIKLHPFISSFELCSNNRILSDK